MNFYIATGLERAEEQRALAKALTELGHQQTYDWASHGSVQAEGPERIREVAVAEASGVSACDLFIALLPGARGTHTEFGMALGNGSKTIVLVGPTEDASGRTCAFYLHPGVDERFANVGELLAWLKGWARGTR